MKLVQPSSFFVCMSIIVAPLLQQTVWVQALAPPSNDICSAAVPFTIGSNVLVDFTEAQAGDLDGIYGCSNEYDHFPDLADPGLWYSFTGTGRRVAFTFAPGSSSYWKVAVFKGTCGAATLKCMAQFTRQSLFSVATEAGVVYRALVRVTQFPDQEPSKFTFTTNDVTFLYENDVCAQAKTIAVNSTINGNVTYATSDELEVSDDCARGTVDYRRRGIWYKFQGTGRKVSALVSSFQGTLSVYRGACGTANLRCVATTATDYSVVFFTEIGTTYYAFKNDICSKAIPVALGSPIAGNLSVAAFQTGADPSCSEPKGGGLWYTFQGTGGRITAVSQCTVDRTWSIWSAAYIYRGSCDASTLQCIAGMRVSPCDKAPFSFNTDAGVTYYMLVQAREGNSAQKFNMTLVSAPLQINDNDVGTKASLLALGSPLVGNNITLATSDEKDVLDDCACGNITKTFSRGLWFSFQGTGGRVWLDVCGGVNATLQLRKTVSVYKGECGPTSLQCVAGRYAPCADEGLDPQKFFFDTDARTKYYALVQDSVVKSQDMPSFDVALKIAPSPPPNDLCSAATPIVIGSTITGDLTFATSDENGVSTVCADEAQGDLFFFPGFWPLWLGSNHNYPPSLWYRFQGTGGSVQLTSTCGLEYSLTNIHIYKGSCGSSTLQCVTGHYNGCRVNVPQNVFNFATEAGVTYYMLVQKSPFGTYSSVFEMKIEPIPMASFVPSPPIKIRYLQCKAGAQFPPPITAPMAAPSIGAPMVIPPAVMPPIISPKITPAPTLLPGGPSPRATMPTPAPKPAAPKPLAPVVAPKPMSPRAAPSPPVRVPSPGKCRIACFIRPIIKTILGWFTW